ncbi:MAG: alkaline phosphatase family protein [Bacteroidales bacterium]
MKCLIIYSLILLQLIPSVFAQSNKKIPPEKPRLVVGIVVSQMRYDYLFRYWDKFSEDGFRKLIGQGTFCKNVRYRNLFTLSSSGNATIATGAYPSFHGIVADEWYDRVKNKNVKCAFDDNYKAVGGSFEAGQYAPLRLITSTIGDEMHLTQPASKVISIATDPVQAVLSSGHTADAAYWYDSGTGQWMTSNYYLKDLPAWVQDFNNKKIPDIYLQESWNTLLPVSAYKESLPDDNPYEKGIRGKKTFPYDINLMSMKGKKREYDLLPYTPGGMMYTRDFAVNAIVQEQLGKDDSTDLLLLNFTTPGLVGSLYGPRSVEVEDIFLRLDLELAFFLRFLEQELGMENVLIYLTADHGSAYVPGYLEEIKIPSGIFNQNQAMALLSSYLNVLYGKGEWIKLYKNQQIYLNQTLIEDSKLPLEQFQTTVANFMVQFTGVANAVTASDLQSSNFTSGILLMIQNNYNQKRSGDVFLNLEPGWMEKSENATSTNSSYAYDAHVPLMWYGWKIGRRTINTAMDPTVIAPTLASFLEILSPNGCMASPIGELVDQ